VQDSSSFILLHEHSKYSKLFIQIVRQTSVRERLSGKVIVRETSCPGNVLCGKRLSGKVIVRETSVTPFEWLSLAWKFASLSSGSLQFLSINISQGSVRVVGYLITALPEIYG